MNCPESPGFSIWPADECYFYSEKLLAPDLLLWLGKSKSPIENKVSGQKRKEPPDPEFFFSLSLLQNFCSAIVNALHFEFIKRSFWLSQEAEMLIKCGIAIDSAPQPTERRSQKFRQTHKFFFCCIIRLAESAAKNSTLLCLTSDAID